MPTILTNKLKLPDPIFEACRTDNYDSVGDISITQLIDAPQIRMLKRQNTLEEDITDRLWMLFGSAVHNVLEKSSESKRVQEAVATVVQFLKKNSLTADDDLSRGADWINAMAQNFIDESKERYMVEKRFVVTVNGWNISGKIDLYDKQLRKIPDYKLCKVYKWTNPESRKSWIRQLNCYAWLMIKSGIPVDSLEIVPFFRDWSAGAKMGSKNTDYPASSMQVIPIELFPMHVVEEYIVGRVTAHQEAQRGIVQPCDGEERWAKGAEFAIKQEGQTSTKAIRKWQTEKEANDWIKNNQYKFEKRLFYEYRPGESARCAKYCPVSEFCPQWADLQRKQDGIIIKPEQPIM